MKLICGDSLEILKKATPNSVDAIVTDPPYGLSFMGKKWDYDVPSVEIWKECYRVLKPGGYLLSFAGTRTQHRMAVNIEDAGFEIRDMIAWVYGSGFPKSLNIGKVMDKFLKTGNASWNGTGDSSNGALGYAKLQHNQGYRPNDYSNAHQNKSEITEELAKQWEGWGTALKPALEPITVARKPLSEKTVAENVLKWGTGGINIDGSRVEAEPRSFGNPTVSENGHLAGKEPTGKWESTQGRFPANLVHDGSDEVVSLFPNTKTGSIKPHSNAGSSFQSSKEITATFTGDSGSAARFFKQCELTEEDIWEQEKLDQTVKSAINQSDLCETPTAQEAVKTQNLDSKTETLPASQDSISNSNDYSQHQNPVQIVATQESIDTTQTIQNSLKSSGSVHPVIDVPINQVNPNSDNAPKRFLYQPKASKADRDEGLDGFELGEPPASARSKPAEGRENALGNPRANHHPTVKPTKLMQYLVKLVTPKGGVVLDPFMGSGSTGKACKLEGFDFIGIEREPEYVEIAKARIENF